MKTSFNKGFDGILSIKINMILIFTGCSLLGLLVQHEKAVFYFGE